MGKHSALGEPERAQGGRLVSVLLVIIGVCAMLVVMWLTARQGWSLQDDIADRCASAAMNILVDAAKPLSSWGSGGGLVAVSPATRNGQPSLDVRRSGGRGLGSTTKETRP